MPDSRGPFGQSGWKIGRAKWVVKDGLVKEFLSARFYDFRDLGVATVTPCWKRGRNEQSDRRDAVTIGQWLWGKLETTISPLTLHTIELAMRFCLPLIGKWTTRVIKDDWKNKAEAEQCKLANFFCFFFFFFFFWRKRNLWINISVIYINCY